MRDNDSTEAVVRAVSPQEAYDRQMFGALYHGTTADIDQIVIEGFDLDKAIPHAIGWSHRPIGSSNGYALEPFGFTGIAPPFHHLGVGVYMTTSKAVAKRFAGGTTKGMRSFYVDSPRILEINYGSSHTMMKWWREHGYDMTSEATRARDVTAWTAATLKLTMALQERYDAVWFKGKGLYRLLDGDQVCIYNLDTIRVVNAKAASGVEIGAKVTHTQTIPQEYLGSNVFYVDDLKPDDFGSAGRLVGWRGIFRADQAPHPTVGRCPLHQIPPAGMVGIVTKPFHSGAQYHNVKWAKGGVMFNYRREELRPAP